jgi:hypothetical protein
MTIDDRSVTAQNITGSIIQTGDRNRAELRAVQLPAVASVDIAAALAALRAELLAIASPDRGKIERALVDADEEAAKDAPDKSEVAGSLERALGYAKKAGDFSEHAGKVGELIVQVGGWLGAASPYVAPLLAAVGLAVG